MSSDDPVPETAPKGLDKQSQSEPSIDPGAGCHPRPRLSEIVQDISASLHDLKAAVREAEGQDETGAGADNFRDLFHLAPEAYLVTDARICIEECNQAASDLLQARREALIGQPLRVFIAAEDRSSFQAAVIHLREGGAKRNWEVRLQPATGGLVPVCITVTAQLDHRDNLVRMLWLMRDAGECRVEEENLKSLVSLLKGSLHGTVEAFARAVEIKDPQTAGHQRRVSQLAVAIARELGFSLSRLEGVKVAGLLHDIGKIAVPTEILSKPGNISYLESELLKTHCRAGFDLLQGIDFPWSVQQVVLQHHERLDGSGYPDGLTDADIVLEAKILGVADVVEAMNSARTYGPAQGIDKALEEINRKRGILYGPDLVDICLKLFVEKGFAFD